MNVINYLGVLLTSGIFPEAFDLMHHFVLFILISRQASKYCRSR
jgi:hypothetical protein